MPEKKESPKPGSAPVGAKAKKAKSEKESKKPESKKLPLDHFLSIGDLEALRDLNVKGRFTIDDDEYDYCKTLNSRLEKAINHLNPGLFPMDPPTRPASEAKAAKAKKEKDKE